VATLARAGQVLTTACVSASPDGVQRVALGAGTAPWSLGPVDLHDPLALVGQEAGQPRPIAAGPLQRPAAARPAARSATTLSSRCAPDWLLGTSSWATSPPLRSRIAAAWASRWVSTPMTASTLPSSIGTCGCPPPRAATVGRRRPGCKSPRGRTVRVTTLMVGQASDQASDVVGQAGAGSVRALRLQGTSTTANLRGSHPRCRRPASHASTPTDQAPAALQTASYGPSHSHYQHQPGPQPRRAPQEASQIRTAGPQPT
jgi:hypothetical protein